METRTFYALIGLGVVSRALLMKNDVQILDLLENQINYSGVVMLGCLGAELGIRISQY